MAELAIPANRGIQVPIFQPINPASYFDKTPTPAPIVDTTGASTTAGKAALYGSISKVLSELPETLQKSYNDGRKFKVGNEVAKQFDQAVQTGDQGALSHFTATGDGALSMKGEDDALEKAKIAYYKQLQLKAAKGPVGKAPVISDYEKSISRFGLKPGDIAAPVHDPSEPAESLSTGDLPQAGDPGDIDTSMLGQIPGASQLAAMPAPAAAPGQGSDGMPINPDASQSNQLLPPVELSPVSQLQSKAAAPQALAGMSPDEIEGAAINIGQQLSNMPISEMSADTAGKTPAATVAPVTKEAAAQAFAGKKAWREENGKRIIESPDGTKETLDLATGFITLETPDGRKLERPFMAKTYRPVVDKGAKAHPGFDTPEELQEFATQHGMIPGNPKQASNGKWYSDNSTFLPKLDRDTQKRLNEANSTGANIQTAGKTPDEVTSALAAWQASSGTLTDSQISHVTHLRDRYSALPLYKTAQNVIEGYHNAKLAATYGSGIGDKTLIEEGQRILNPGNGVAVQTMKMFGASSGLLERITPSYITDHLKRGKILTDEQRAEYLNILNKAYAERVKDMDTSALQHTEMAKKARVPEDFAKSYFDNPYSASNKPESKQLDPKDAEALDWVNTNPTDPRAAGIKAALRAKGIQ